MVPNRRLRATSDDPYEEGLNALADILERIEEKMDDRQPIKGDGNGGVYLPRWVAALLLGTMLTMIVSFIYTFASMNTRLSIIESNRFTDADAGQMRRAIEAQIPPPEVLRRLLDHERRLEGIERQTGNE